MMKLDSNNYGINLIFELTVTSDLDVDPEDIVYSIAKQLQLKKENEGFLVNSLTMEYSVHKDTETLEV
tara:strand:- start:1398 stop:1601 length:204 start_codon:yes stop_codon:yes gene_type:complete